MRMIRSAWGVGLLTLASRLLGLVRDKALVLVFGGAPALLDAFFLAFTIPNLFRRLFGEGALSSAFMPVFIDARENRSKDEAARLASATATALTLLLAALTVVGMAVSGGAALLLGRAHEHWHALLLTAAMLPFMLFVCLSALLSGILQSLRVFLLPAAMPMILNVAFLGVLAYIHFHRPGADPAESIYWVAGAVVAAGALQALIQFPVLRLLGVRIGFSLTFGQEGLRRVLVAMGPTVLGLAVFQVNVLVDRLIAYALIADDGALTHLYLGNRLMQLPLALFGVSLATTAFPELVSHMSRGEWEPLFRKVAASARFLAFIILPASAGIAALAAPIVRMIFQEPDLAFSDASVYRTALVLACYAPGLFCIGCQQLLTRLFYAQGDYSTPVRITGAMVGVNLALNLLLIHAPDLYLRWFAAQPVIAPLGEGGLALATTLTSLLTLWLMWRAIRPRLRTGTAAALWDREFAAVGGSLGWIAAASAGSGVFAYLTARSIPAYPELFYRLERGLVPVAAGVLCYLLLCVTIPIPEFEEFLGRSTEGRAGEGEKGPDGGGAR